MFEEAESSCDFLIIGFFRLPVRLSPTPALFTTARYLKHGAVLHLMYNHRG